MKKFLVVERQVGGCDYTIGCGVRVYTEEAESMAALVAKFKRGCVLTEDECYGTDAPHPDESDLWDRCSGWLEGEQARESVAVYEIGESVALSLVVWRKEARVTEAARAAADAEKNERDTLKKLQQKYGAP